MTNERILDTLPLHPTDRPPQDTPLRILGNVSVPSAYDPAALASLLQTTLTEDFICEAGWRVPGQTWRGVQVGVLLDAAGVQSDGGWVEFASGDFRFSLPVDEARRALVAQTLNGNPLDHTHGGPNRLLVPGGACFTSIKWLDRIEVRAEAGPDQAAQIARARIAAGTL